MAKTIAVVQSNYIPWKGYFDLIRLADEFVILDDVQYTRRDWRNRNVIKTSDGLRWLTIPVKTRGRYSQTIRDTEIEQEGWARNHWKQLTHAYARAAHFRTYAERVEDAYMRAAKLPLLSGVNRLFIDLVTSVLDISTALTSSSDYVLHEERTTRLLSICQQAGATRYLSGPAARAYLRMEDFAAAGIEVRYMDYSGYPEYPQLFPPFEHRVSVIDLLFNAGPAASLFLSPN